MGALTDSPELQRLRAAILREPANAELHYLLGAATIAPPPNRTFDIGGPEILTYEDMMKVYGQVAQLSARRVLALPVLTPRLASLWVGLVTPLPSRLVRPLIESVQCEAIAHECDIDAVISPPATRAWLIASGSAPSSRPSTLAAGSNAVIRLASPWPGGPLSITAAPSRCSCCR